VAAAIAISANIQTGSPARAGAAFHRILAQQGVSVHIHTTGERSQQQLCDKLNLGEASWILHPNSVLQF
jgi:hypothetical protein